MAAWTGASPSGSRVSRTKAAASPGTSPCALSADFSRRALPRRLRSVSLTRLSTPPSSTCRTPCCSITSSRAFQPRDARGRAAVDRPRCGVEFLAGSLDHLGDELRRCDIAIGGVIAKAFRRGDQDRGRLGSDRSCPQRLAYGACRHVDQPFALAAAQLIVRGNARDDLDGAKGLGQRSFPRRLKGSP